MMISSRVCYSTGNSQPFFQSYKGVRQRENLSPVLFAIFLNDLESFPISNNCKGIDLTLRYEQVILFLKT